MLRRLLARRWSSLVNKYRVNPICSSSSSSSMSQVAIQERPLTKLGKTIWEADSGTSADLYTVDWLPPWTVLNYAWKCFKCPFSNEVTSDLVIDGFHLEFFPASMPVLVESGFDKLAKQRMSSDNFDSLYYVRKKRKKHGSEPVPLLKDFIACGLASHILVGGKAVEAEIWDSSVSLESGSAQQRRTGYVVLNIKS